MGLLMDKAGLPISYRLFPGNTHALLIARIAELRLGGKYTIAGIVETLRKVECSNIDQNLWLFDFADEVTDDINVSFGADFGLKAMALKNIRKNLGLAKRG
jgi:hypothetical protein